MTRTSTYTQVSTDPPLYQRLDNIAINININMNINININIHSDNINLRCVESR